MGKTPDDQTLGFLNRHRAWSCSDIEDDLVGRNESFVHRANSLFVSTMKSASMTIVMVAYCMKYLFHYGTNISSAT